MTSKNITIDGPAGSGKSTISKLLAKELGLKYIDTGAMYRTITLLAIRNNIDLEDEKSILEKASKSTLILDNNVKDENDYTKVILNGLDVTNDIRSRKVGESVSIVSKLSGVRKLLVKMQRDIASKDDSILEGRDTGSVVCRDALLKIFLTASLEKRISRRKKQLFEKKQESDTQQIKNEITNRDKIDSGRKDSPLIIPEDGIEIDTSDMSIREVVDKIKKLYIERVAG